MTRTITLLKWTLSPNGQWVQLPFDLTITPGGKSDKPATANGDHLARRAS
jgi:hypothetical protein